jgi:hypothetical protein
MPMVGLARLPFRTNAAACASDGVFRAPLLLLKNNKTKASMMNVPPPVPKPIPIAAFIATALPAEDPASVELLWVEDCS